MPVFHSRILPSIRGNRCMIPVMSSCTRVAVVSAALLKNTQCGNGSVACRARYAVVRKSRNNTMDKLMEFVLQGQCEGRLVLISFAITTVQNSLLILLTFHCSLIVFPHEPRNVYSLHTSSCHSCRKVS